MKKVNTKDENIATQTKTHGNKHASQVAKRNILTLLIVVFVLFSIALNPCKQCGKNKPDETITRAVPNVVVPNEKEIEIKDFNEGFLDSIIRIHNESFDESLVGVWTRDMFLSYAKDSNVKFKVLLKNKTVVGHYIISSEYDGYGNEVMHVLTIAVDANFRRKNFGRTMLLDIKKEAVNKKAKLIVLETWRDNVAAVSLYKSFGFVEVGIREKYYGNGTVDAILFELVM
jgi:ribosomal protein S18 acetylase RimI-like enzyme